MGEGKLFSTMFDQSFFIKLVCAILSGGLLYLSFPPIDWWWLSYIALVPILFVVPFTSSFPKCLFYCGVTVLFFYIPALVWLAAVAIGGWLLLSAYLAVYLGIFCLIARKLHHSSIPYYPLSLAVIWVALEFIRAYVITGFPWLFLGHTQYRFPAMMQLASVTGVYGISFLLVFFNVALSEFLRDLLSVYRQFAGKNEFFKEVLKLQSSKSLPCALVLIFLSISYGAVTINRFPTEQGPVVGVVQNNVPPELPPSDIIEIYSLTQQQVGELSDSERHILRRRLAQYRQGQEQKWYAGIERAVRLSKKLAKKNPALIAWPETAVDVPLNPGSRPYLDSDELKKHDFALNEIKKLTENLNSYLLVGALDLKTYGALEGRTSNSAFLFNPDGEIIGSYDKIHLVPFGEYTPLREFWPAPVRRMLDSFAIAQSVPGQEPVVFQEPVPFSTAICYDNVFSPLMRKFRRKGADVLINISNEGWYPIKGELEQHLALAVFRAVETRTTVVRATNTGISCFIDPKGKLYGIVEKQVEGQNRYREIDGSLAKAVYTTDKIPFYVRFGDWFAMICLFTVILAVIWKMLRNRCVRLLGKNSDDAH